MNPAARVTVAMVNKNRENRCAAVGRKGQAERETRRARDKGRTETRGTSDRPKRLGVGRRGAVVQARSGCNTGRTSMCYCKQAAKDRRPTRAG